MSPITSRAGLVAWPVLGLVLPPSAHASGQVARGRSCHDPLPVAHRARSGLVPSLRVQALDLPRLHQKGRVPPLQPLLVEWSHAC